MKRLRSAVHSLTLMPFGNSGAACPEGAYENSQAFQWKRRDSGRAPPSPEGTAELPRPFASIQPSRRDLNALDHVPGVETPGYCRQSLRDNAAAPPHANFRKALSLRPTVRRWHKPEGRGGRGALRCWPGLFLGSTHRIRSLALGLPMLLATCMKAADTNPAVLDAIAPLRPPRAEIPPTFWEQYGLWVMLAAFLLLGLAGAAVWYFNRPGQPILLAPEVQARQALESLRQQPEDGAVLIGVSQILKHYVAAAFGLPAGELTTSEFCRALAGHEPVGPELSAAFADFLRHCDERKFAPGGPLPALNAVAQAFGLVELAEARRAQLRQAATAQAQLQPLQPVPTASAKAGDANQ